MWAPDSQEKCTGCVGRRLEGLPAPGPGAALGWGLARHLPPTPHPPPASGELPELAPRFPSAETRLPACLPKPPEAHAL